MDITELYAAHRLSLVRLAVLLVDDIASAEDVVQDAFAALARRPDAVKDVRRGATRHPTTRRRPRPRTARCWPRSTAR